MSTGFYNTSKDGAVGPGLLFYRLNHRETSAFATIVQFTKLKRQLNTVNVGEEIYSTTDSTIMVAVDPASLNVTGNFKITSKNIKFGEIAFVGSAHQLNIRRLTTGWISLAQVA